MAVNLVLEGDPVLAFWAPIFLLDILTGTVVGFGLEIP